MVGLRPNQGEQPGKALQVIDPPQPLPIHRQCVLHGGLRFKRDDDVPAIVGGNAFGLRRCRLSRRDAAGCGSRRLHLLMVGH